LPKRRERGASAQSMGVAPPPSTQATGAAARRHHDALGSTRDITDSNEITVTTYSRLTGGD